MTVLVTGATGSVGREVLAQLMQVGADVRASTRNPASSSLPDNVDVRAVDLARPSTLSAALDDIDSLYLFPSFEDPEGIAQTIADSNVTRIVLLSSISTSLPDADDQPNAARFLHLERALESTDVAYTFLRSGEFAGNISFYAPGIAEGAVHVPFAASLHLPIDERDIAEIAVVGLTSDTLAGQKPRLTGEQVLSLREEIEIIAAAAGHPVQITEMPEQQALAEFVPEAPRGLIKAMMSMWKSTLEHPPEPSPAVRTITGHEPRRFADWAQDHVDQFR